MKFAPFIITIAAFALVAWGIAAYTSPDAVAARSTLLPYEEAHAELRLQQAQRWDALQQQHEPLVSAAQTYGSVAFGGLVFLFLAGVGYSLVLAAINAAQGVQWDRRYAMRQLTAQTQVLVADAQYRHPHVPHSLSYTQHAKHEAASVLPGDVAQSPTLPGPVDLASISHTPTPHSILLAIGDDGQPITVSAKNLMHTGLVGATGGGKSNTGRLLLSQLLACNVQCVIADPHFAAYDAESGEDWRAIAQRLHLAPAVKAGQIEDLFRWLADEMTRRYDLRNVGQRPGAPLVCYVDELPAIVANVPGAMDTLGSLLREGRKVRLYLVTSSQDLLTKTLQTGGEIRENLRTAYYSGGAGHSAVQLLDMSKKDIATYERQLGQGVVLLRSAARPQTTLARVPLASNQGIARLLPDDLHSQAETLDTAPPRQGNGNPTAKEYTAAERRILDMFANGASMAEIAREISGAKNGRRYTEASEQVQAVVRGALQEREVGA
jgi:hypothetical protein